MCECTYKFAVVKNFPHFIGASGVQLAATTTAATKTECVDCTISEIIMEKDAKQQAINRIVMKLKKKQIQNSHKIQIRPRCVSVYRYTEIDVHACYRNSKKNINFVSERASKCVCVCII